MLKGWVVVVLLVFGLLCDGVWAHAGGRDKNGGHTNKATGEYHCHQEPCFSQRQQVEAATVAAEGDGVAFTSLYNRKDWPHWIDTDKDCQNARAEALIAASRVPVKFKRSKGCVVSQGEWFDLYTGLIFTKASELDIDHIVPQKEAHISGGHGWTKAQRRVFANDPDNLLVVSAGENREKGAQDPSSWLPDTLAYRCDYVRLWLAVKAKYQLAIDAAEQAAIDKQLLVCGD